MSHKGKLLAVFVLLLLLGIVLDLQQRNPEDIDPPQPVPTVTPVPTPAPTATAYIPARAEVPFAAPTPLPTATPTPPRINQVLTITVAPIAKETLRLHQPDTRAEDDIDILHTLFESYHRSFRDMPVAGTNDEFVDALTGNNALGIQLLPADHPSINSRGELLDRWGTPYFFHPMSDREVEITSAGPDLQLFTDDDVTFD